MHYETGLFWGGTIDLHTKTNALHSTWEPNMRMLAHTQTDAETITHLTGSSTAVTINLHRKLDLFGCIVCVCHLIPPNQANYSINTHTGVHIGMQFMAAGGSNRNGCNFAHACERAFLPNTQTL